MLKKIIAELQKQKVSGWQIREARKRSFQSFLAKEERESARTVDTRVYGVSIFQRRSQGGKDVLGLSSFKLTPRDESAIEKSVSDALFAASLVGNEPFDLPEQPAHVHDVVLADPSLDQNTLEEFEARLRAAVARHKSARLSSAEFFIDHVDSRLVNSRGLDLNQKESRIETEFILLSRTEGRENEFISRYARRLKKDFDLEGEVLQSARFALNATKAILPQTGTFPVLLSEEPLDNLFNPIVARASGRLKYNNMITTGLGKSVVEEGERKGDALTLWSNGTLAGASGSHRYDSYGTPAGRACLIEENIVKRFLADKRYADYLKVEPTGELGNIEVAPGSVPFDNMVDPAWAGTPVIYHLQAFSAFEPNAITGAFSAEIRAGYELSKAGARSIKGGSVSGVLQRDLLNCYFSKEQTQRESVLAPKGVFFKNLTIAGA